MLLLFLQIRILIEAYKKKGGTYFKYKSNNLNKYEFMTQIILILLINYCIIS